MFRLLIVALHVRCVSKCSIKLLDPLGRSVELMVVESSASSELRGGTGRNKAEQRSGATKWTCPCREFRAWPLICEVLIDMFLTLFWRVSDIWQVWWGSLQKRAHGTWEPRSGWHLRWSWLSILTAFCSLLFVVQVKQRFSANGVVQSHTRTLYDIVMLAQLPWNETVERSETRSLFHNHSIDICLVRTGTFNSMAAMVNLLRVLWTWLRTLKVWW